VRGVPLSVSWKSPCLWAGVLARYALAHPGFPSEFVRHAPKFYRSRDRRGGNTTPIFHDGGTRSR
jgi:hypothetical protein